MGATRCSQEGQTDAQTKDGGMERWGGGGELGRGLLEDGQKDGGGGRWMGTGGRVSREGPEPHAPSQVAWRNRKAPCLRKEFPRIFPPPGPARAGHGSRVLLPAPRLGVDQPVGTESQPPVPCSPLPAVVQATPIGEQKEQMMHRFTLSSLHQKGPGLHAVAEGTCELPPSEAGVGGVAGKGCWRDTGHGVSELRSLTLSFTVLFFLLK